CTGCAGAWAAAAAGAESGGAGGDCIADGRVSTAASGADSCARSVERECGAVPGRRGASCCRDGECGIAESGWGPEAWTEAPRLDGRVCGAAGASAVDGGALGGGVWARGGVEGL